ncbi:MAG TPA: hypothetical protein VMP12_11980 [Candidatus Sulfotelmatobacter sp.]|nr:hypothetical protein [Candidatus Sulfotelmatobacter sp.]
MIRTFIVSMGLLAAGTWVCSVGAQQQNQDQASTATDGSTSAKAKPKKVWTNDDMGDVTGTISVVGSAQQKPATTPSKISSLQQITTAKASPGKSADAKTSDGSVDPKILAQVRQQLQKLQANIDQLDKQIDQLKGASRGDSKNLGVLTSDPSSYSTAPVPDQIKALEAKKSALQTSMDNLLDAARASGIEPGQLR